MKQFLLTILLLVIFSSSVIAQQFIDNQGRIANCAISNGSMIVEQGGVTKIFYPVKPDQTVSWISPDGWNAFLTKNGTLLTLNSDNLSFSFELLRNGNIPVSPSYIPAYSGRPRDQILRDIQRTQESLNDCINNQSNANKSGSYVAAMGYNPIILNYRQRLNELNLELMRANH
ncbi:MAG: hypothetical protein FDX18_03840 [Chlorobium sp.]|nr:MAG: hypothetical protein FDX18_03840 [Chlorobium sp.]